MKNTIVNEIILKMQSILNARQVDELKKYYSMCCIIMKYMKRLVLTI